ncbi:thiamine ABC transporter ATP-binding protein [Zobellella taiwanensis]|jgi:thiamine transport system ATP-binding protein|uniref:Thiamine ABC transporter ATP-binding protein n=1 Tax=Zobellella taiwanensis TaxID=347535 RepID=A0A2P7R258_9GAMM|nr:thiamine ABC transporter ATP-binding protein [Zobellella taiwanensis]PSJ44298.1 thiamine ABC transporter ATP-binding protein [Zobellella taiwanensis]
MLELNELSASYPEQQLCFSLRAAPGTITALIGPSGAGKSTMLAMIGGFTGTSSGQLLLDGQSLRSLEPARRPITTLFQDNNLFWHMTVYQNIAIGLHPGLKLSTLQQQEIIRVAEQVGIAGLLERKPGQLSGGQQQRVGLARSLARRQPVLLLDEPFSALDPALRFELLELLRTQTDKLGLTVLLVTHHPDEAARVADRIAFVYDGKIIEQGDRELLSAPRTSALRNYLGR